MKYILTTILCFGLITVFGFRNPESATPATPSSTQNAALNYRMSCAQATVEDALDINNVRATLLVGGDVWWDGSDGSYIVPNVAAGEVAVSSIFAGAVWLGGFDPAGNLKLAAQQYGTGNGTSDFWPGPLTETGNIDDETCDNWDNFFTVTGAEIDLHIAQFQQSIADGTEYDVSLIPDGVKGWPGKGNQFFFDIFGFDLPTAQQGLGAFHDENFDDLYTPEFGDYPIIEIRGCVEPQYPDQMKFWIYNDAGNIHTESQGDAIRMEVQVQAFAYATNDELNNMTFNRYKLINRAVESIDSTYFAMWVDADLGCSEDDFIGCDTTRSLMYIYNADAVDGSTGTNCTGGVETYGNDVPYLGVDYFRGPRAPKVWNSDSTMLINPAIGQTPDSIVEIGMTSFLYFNRASATTLPQQTDPNTTQQYYNYLTGSWSDGSPVTFGGNGLGGTEPTSFTFPDEPNDAAGWSMCTAGLGEEDRRTIQASGPFRLDPGQVNELIIGVPWVPNVTYPCPDMGRLQRADDVAQGLFDSCFDIIDGPDAPDANWVELDQRIIGVLSNDNISSNNKDFEYVERDPLAPSDLTFEANYLFEGFLVYQLADINVAIDELDDPDKARIVFQSDVENGASTLFNWGEVENPNATNVQDPTIRVPELKVEGENTGVRTSFELTQDIFTGNDLINHTTYYYTAIAYAFNEYQPYDAITQFGQLTPYLEGRRNIQTYSVTPRPIADKNLQSNYGDGAVVTRLDGIGVGGNFLVLSNEERTRLLESQTGLAGYEGEITYQPGGGPVAISVIDPLRVRDGLYTIRLDQSAELENGQSSWEIFDADANESLGRSTQNLQNQNEELFPDLGLSVTIQQTADAGDLANASNGAVGQTIEYADPRLNWLIPVPDNANTAPGLGFFDLHYQPTGGGELNGLLDPTQAFTDFGSGHFAPFTLFDWTTRPNFYGSPGWFSTSGDVAQERNPLETLNNVDIVYTNDKSMWSRCVVVETGNNYFTSQGFELDDNKGNFEVVNRPSVSKDDNDGDGRPDPDGSGNGFAWFPGYAIDVETGVRVNIFFGENSAFGDNSLAPQLLTEVNGSDMMFNPSDQAALFNPGVAPTAFNLVLGGMHYMYVTKQPYDECAFIAEKLSENFIFRRVDAIVEISWAGIPLRNPEVPLLSYADGLIPTETVVSLRVDNPYDTALGTNDNATFPSYQFRIENQEALPLTTADEVNGQLDLINVVPNPYLAFSAYENTRFENVVKITNLPAKCVVTIYSLDGQFIRQYNRDEVELRNEGANPGVAFGQVNPAIEWDVKNTAGIPVASGVYLIHINAEGLGERVIKWFGVNRQFDPAGL